LKPSAANVCFHARTMFLNQRRLFTFFLLLAVTLIIYFSAAFLLSILTKWLLGYAFIHDDVNWEDFPLFNFQNVLQLTCLFLVVTC